MANPLIPGISATEQDLLYKKLSIYNQKKASFKEAGAYLVVLPRTDYPRYSLWVYSPLPERQSIFYIFDLNEDVHEALRIASTLCYYSLRPLLLVEYNAKRMQLNRSLTGSHRSRPFSAIYVEGHIMHRTV